MDKGGRAREDWGGGGDGVGVRHDFRTFGVL
jgi:hypothetical protein